MMNNLTGLFFATIIGVLIAGAFIVKSLIDEVGELRKAQMEILEIIKQAQRGLVG